MTCVDDDYFGDDPVVLKADDNTRLLEAVVIRGNVSEGPYWIQGFVNLVCVLKA